MPHHEAAIQPGGKQDRGSGGTVGAQACPTISSTSGQWTWATSSPSSGQATQRQSGYMAQYSSAVSKGALPS